MDAPAPFAVVKDPVRPDWSRLVLRGRVTVAVAAELHAAAVALLAGGTNVCVDFVAAEYLDVSALQTFLALGRELAAVGRHCDISDVPAAVTELFRVAGLRGAA